jgi:hypothetical protein
LTTAHKLSGRLRHPPYRPESQQAEQNARAERWKRYLEQHNLKPNARAYAEEQVKKYRSDKRFSRRLRDIREEDRGRYRQKTITTWPHGTHREKRNIPKQKTGLWQTIWSHVVYLRYSKLQDRYYLYDRYDECLGEISAMDLYSFAKAVMFSIGGFREEVHWNRKGRWTVYIVKSPKQFKGAGR